MKLNGSTLFWTFIWCIFMGITVGSIGIGAIFPSANLIAKPFICPRGEMQLETQDYHPSPIETVTTLTWYCVGPEGDKTELGIFPMSLYAGTIYGLLLFIVVFVVMQIRGSTSIVSSTPSVDHDIVRRTELARERAEEFRHSAADLGDLKNKGKASQDAMNRMKELKDLREANLISESEYEQKRADIIKNL